MAFKMNGFNAGHGTGMNGSPNKATGGSSPNKAAGQILKGLGKGAVQLFKKGGKNVVKVADDVAATGGKATIKETAKNTGKMNFQQFMKKPGATEAKWKKYSKMLAKGVAADVAISNVMGWGTYGTVGDIFGMNKDKEEISDEEKKKLQEHVDSLKDKEETSNAADKGAEIANAGKTPPKKDPYADAKKNDPNLDKHIAERDKHKKGTPEYDAAQNRINKAYGDRTRHGVTKSKGTKGRDTVSRLNVPGIVDKAKLERKRKIGGTKVIQQNVNLQTGEHKEKKTKGDKSKERFYDAEGNLTRKTKDKKNKQKDITKTEHTVTKVKTNKRTGKVKVKTRRRRGQKTGEFFKSLVGK